MKEYLNFQPNLVITGVYRGSSQTKLTITCILRIIINQVLAQLVFSILVSQTRLLFFFLHWVGKKKVWPNGHQQLVITMPRKSRHANHWLLTFPFVPHLERAQKSMCTLKVPYIIVKDRHVDFSVQWKNRQSSPSSKQIIQK